MKRFNVTGLCVPKKHYMVDISGKIDEILKLVHYGDYFTINRARQYGKTTTLNQLKHALLSDIDYLCASISFESVSSTSFDTEGAFCNMFLQKISRALKQSNVEISYAERWFNPDISNFVHLNEHITDLCEDKKVVLIIDEVDKSTNNKLFLFFLGMLRAKYLDRQADADYTFHSVILAGVTDVKNLKLKMINDGIHSRVAEEGRIFNSPWNIAASFNVDMSFNCEEISTMLDEYERDNNSGMDVKGISEEICEYTSGYPMLVSRICKCIDEELGKNWTKTGVSDAVNIILREENVLFDDMTKNLGNNDNLRQFLYELLILGDYKLFNTDDEVVSFGSMYGYLSRGSGNGRAVISNKIFERRITNYFVAKEANAALGNKPVPGVLFRDVIKGNVFDMELCLKKFAEHYAEIYTREDMPFLERHGRLLFLSYLKPLLNGQGHYHIESAFTDLRRMDVVVDFLNTQFIIELKLWKGETAKEKAYDQLLGYMESKNAKEGYLLTFDFRKQANKERKAEWVEFDGLKIYDVVV